MERRIGRTFFQAPELSRCPDIGGILSGRQGAEVDEVEVFGVFGGDLPAGIRAAS